MPIAETGMTVYWADGKRTTFTLLGDLQTSRFPNTDPEFFKWFGENWVVRPDPANGQRGIRQSLIVDAETISNNVGRLLELMREGDNEWQIPPGPISDLQMHAAAAVRFPQGWAGSAERRKYLPGSVASDPKPKPPAEDPRDATIKELRAALESANAETASLRTKLADSIAAKEKAEKVPAAVRVEVQRGRSTLGAKPAGKWWQEMKKALDSISKVVG